MKTKRISILAIAVLLAACTAKAQEYKIQVQNNKEGKLILNNFRGEVSVTGYNGTDIVISTGEINTAPPERSKGLKPVYASGTDNTGLGLDVQKTGNQVAVVCLLPITRNSDYQIKVPDNMAIEMAVGCESSGDILVKGMKNEIEIKSCHGITLEDVSGPLVLSNIAGNIDVKLSSIAANTPFSINSVSGEIDVTLPATAPVDLEMRTITGQFYSDFDFPQPDKSLKKVGGNELKSALNGGGSKFTLATVSSNIYLRKGK